MKKLLSLFLTFILSLSLFACSDVENVLKDLGLDNESNQNQENIKQGLVDKESNNNQENNDSKKNSINIDNEDTENQMDENASYTSKEDVSLYIHTYDKLPKNYITKKEATDLGWDSSKGNLWDVTDEKSIGGDRFGNREKKLPIEQGRQYYECDINYKGAYRGPERLVYSDDGLIYYTGDHYENFELLYGEE